MSRREQGAIAFGPGGVAAAQARNNLLQRVARGNLRLMAPRHKPIRARLHRRARDGALGPQRFKPRLVDGLERQTELKTRVRRGVQLARCPERALALELGAVALETDWRPRRLALAVAVSPNEPPSSLKLLSTCRAKRPRPLALELPAGEFNPVVLSSLGGSAVHVPESMRGV